MVKFRAHGVLLFFGGAMLFLLYVPASFPPWDPQLLPDCSAAADTQLPKLQDCPAASSIA